MTTPLYPQLQGSRVWIAASSMPNDSDSTAGVLKTTHFCATAVKRMTNTSYGNGGLWMNVQISGSYGTDPAGAGALQLIVVDRSSDGIQGPTPTAATARQVYAFNPGPTTNSAQIFTIPKVPISEDCDLWLWNNATGYTFTYTNTMNSSASAFGVSVWTLGS